jgi:type II restriction enzyme
VGLIRLSFDEGLASKYVSVSQQIRVQTEAWVAECVGCPSCGNGRLSQYQNNRPAADFYCERCREDFELKAKAGKFGGRVVDGAYHTMLERVSSDTNPNLFLLSYDKTQRSVVDLVCIPKHLLLPSMIEKRKPLPPTARRAGWVGCNIRIEGIPNSGKIHCVRDRVPCSVDDVVSAWQRTLFLRLVGETPARGWLLDVMRVIDKVGTDEFDLDAVYAFEQELARMHPGNKHIRAKVRQQLQVMRDCGYLEFTGSGTYRLL